MEPLTVALGTTSVAALATTVHGYYHAHKYKKERDREERRRSGVQQRLNDAKDEVRMLRRKGRDYEDITDEEFQNLPRVSDIAFWGVTEEADRDYRGYKAVRGGIAHLIIPKGATVVVPKGGSKLRADRAYVHKIEGSNGEEKSISESIHNGGFQYVVGQYVEPEEELNTNTEIECGSGIHFFSEIGDAVTYYQIRMGQYALKDRETL